MKADEQLISEISSVMKLDYTGEELKQLTEETNETLSMLAALNEVDTEGVAETFYGSVKQEARLRPDEPVQDEKEVEELLEQAIASKDHFIEVPAILDDGEGGA